MTILVLMKDEMSKLKRTVPYGLKLSPTGAFTFLPLVLLRSQLALIYFTYESTLP